MSKPEFCGLLPSQSSRSKSCGCAGQPRSARQAGEAYRWRPMQPSLRATRLESASGPITEWSSSSRSVSFGWLRSGASAWASRLPKPMGAAHRNSPSGSSRRRASAGPADRAAITMAAQPA